MDQTRICPTCGATIPIDPLYPTWCDACGWNLAPETPARPPGRLDRSTVEFGRRSGRALADEVIRNGPRRPTLTLSAASAYVISITVYALIAVLVWEGVSTALGGNIHPAKFLFIAITLALAALMFPRPARLDGDLLTRSDLPAFFTFLDGLADTLGAPRVEGIVIDHRFNASYGQYGWRRRRVVSVGLPLYWALEPEMRVALYGHELGHGMNGDPTRGFIVGSALEALVKLSRALRPPELVVTSLGCAGVIALPVTLLMLGLARLFLAIAHLLAFLSYRSIQRAEYYADAISLRAGGRAATLGSLERMHAARILERMVWINDVGDPVAKIARLVRSIPHRELDRIRRVERMTGSRLDYTHPPTAFRIDVIEAQPDTGASYSFDPELVTRIDAELEPFRASAGRRIVDDYVASISR